MKLIRNVLTALAAVSLLLAAGCQTDSGSAAAPVAGLASGAPRTFENAAPAGLPAVIALNEKLAPSDDEIVIYYVRPDKNYAAWALWLWAIPGGDGGAAWPKTQEWTVEDGIGYMRYKKDGSNLGGIRPIGTDGQFGMIARMKSGWTKDGDDDRIWDSNVSNVVVIFSGDKNTYAASEYKPKAMTAVLETPTRVQILLSGRYGLDTDGGDSGFSLTTRAGKQYGIKKVFNTESPDNLAFNYTRRVTIDLAEPVNPADALILNNPVFEGPKQVDATRLAVELAEKSVPAKAAVLGAVYNRANKSATFSLWAPTSSEAKVLIYRTDRATAADYTVPMTLDSKTGIWSATFSTVDPNGLFYTYSVTNSKGTLEVLDPYARSMAAYRNEGGHGRGAIVDMADPRSLPDGGMNAPFVNLVQREDAIIYEVSVRDLTISPDAAVRGRPGTYAAFIEKIPYIKSLGVTHVQLLPVVNFYFTDEMNQAYEATGTTGDNNYNWGYDPHNYFTPEGWFSLDPANPYARVKELRTLINELHKAGLGVLLDVVYNHMAGTHFLDDIVPGYYFRLNAQGKFTSNSGCGNDVATERIMSRKLIVDSIRHWVQEYKVDGFRFDLMGLMDTQTVLDGYEAAVAINPNTLFVGEGWKMYNGSAGTVGMDQAYMTKTDKVAVFNDEIRDLLKAGGFAEEGQGFITKRGVDTERLFRNVLGQPQNNYKADDPGDNLNYIAAHDGLTLHDSIAHNAKLNPAVPAERAEIARRIKMGNWFMLTGQGIAFLHAGQERGRTKPNLKDSKNETIGKYVRNSYDSADNINQIVWNLQPEYQGVLDYTKSMIALRRQYDVFRIGDMAKVNRAAKLLPSPEESRLTLSYSIDWTDGKWFMVANGEAKPMTFDLGENVAAARVMADANGANVNGISSPSGITVSGNTVTLEPLTAVVLRLAK